MYVACEGLSDLVHGPNQPTATIIGEYSASYHHGTLILTLVIARNWSFRPKSCPNFLTTHHWCLACSQCVCSLWRVVRPCSWTQPAYCNNHWWIQCLIPSWYTDTYSGHCLNWSFRPKSCLTFWPHIIDVWHVPSVYAACEGLSDLVHGPNQPTATIIGEYSASYHHGTLILTLVIAQIDPSDQNLA